VLDLWMQGKEEEGKEGQEEKVGPRMIAGDR
jgi:hypothetical protein